MKLILELEHNDVFVFWYCIKEMIKKEEAPEGSDRTLQLFKDEVKSQLGYNLT